MGTRKPITTRLQRTLGTLGLKSMHVVKEADRIARELGRAGISRQHFGRLKSGRPRRARRRFTSSSPPSAS